MRKRIYSNRTIEELKSSNIIHDVPEYSYSNRTIEELKLTVTAADSVKYRLF